ncbi:PxKF domain-containing protein [Salsipaludibacter albus]|uniref:PxKF domain-containing protein n=1 Tax=Salsipaludibacter albus TaxID=2849650 RepID=UPI001EE48E41|nr:PxKF domain-containing protein [Salsipaludibacter albus]MBY5164014.1 PxKF domain-containing protein [Salsipaludibacter albus]
MRPPVPSFLRRALRPTAALAAALLVLTGTAALADEVELLDDDLDALSSVDFGTVCVGDPASSTVEVRLRRAGNGLVFANSSSAAVSGVGPAGVSVGTAAIPIPSNWFTGPAPTDNGKLAGPVPVAVTLDTSVPRIVDGTVTIQATGPRQPGSGGGSSPTVTASDSVAITGTVEDCIPDDPTSPVIEVVLAPTVPDGTNGWYVSDVSLTWIVTDPESDWVVDEGCVDQVLTTDQVTTFTCTVTSAGGTSSTSVTISRDATAPTISATVDPAANDDGWNNEAVTVTFACDDALSGIVSCTDPVVLATEGVDQSATGTAVDAAGNTAEVTVDDVDIDLTAPTITGTASPAPNANGWNNTPVTVAFTCADALSGIRTCGPDVVLDTEGADQSVTGTAVDLADNTAEFTVDDIDIDLTAPEVVLVGGPQDGATYFPHEVPAAPTCTASDALSGLDGPCTVDDGWSDQVGTHTIVATATDLAGNVGTATATYEVVGYTLEGFLRPVDPDTLNTVKGGRTVPLKFRVLAGDEPVTDVAVVEAITLSLVACDAGDGGGADLGDAAATGGTGLRYDDEDEQFVFNWQTPRTSGQCREVTAHLVGGQTITARFRLR